MQFMTACLTNQGGREANQDFTGFIKKINGGCWALADGLGGYQAGEIASKLAVETILSQYEKNKNIHWLYNGIEHTQMAIREHLLLETNLKSMRTTLVVLLCEDNQATWAHIGDSRLYLVRDGKIIVQTKDHSVCQALVNAGEITPEQIRFHEDRNRLYRVLGSEGAIKATVLSEAIPIYAGDVFLLCSDGFWEYVTEEEMENTRIICSNPDDWLHLMEGILKVRVSGSNDNYSAIAVFVNE